MVKLTTVIINIINLTGLFVACKSNQTVYENTNILNYENFHKIKRVPISLIDKSPLVSSIQEINVIDTTSLVSGSELTPTEEHFIYDFDVITGWRNDMKSDTLITQDHGPVVINETRDNWIKNVRNSSKVKLLSSLENNGVKLLLILFEQKLDLYVYSSRIYAIGMVNNEVKSIVQVASSSINEDSFIKSYTVFNKNSFIYKEVYKNSTKLTIEYKYSSSGFVILI